MKSSRTLLVTALGITRLDSAHTAVRDAVGRLGRIDVLVNNAASFYDGFTSRSRRPRSCGRRSRSPCSAR